MKIYVLASQDKIKEDYEVSDGESMMTEFNIRAIDISLLSKTPKKEVLIELIDERDKNMVSLEVDIEDLKKLISEIIDAFGDKDEGGSNYIL